MHKRGYRVDGGPLSCSGSLGATHDHGRDDQSCDDTSREPDESGEHDVQSLGDERCGGQTERESGAGGTRSGREGTDTPGEIYSRADVSSVARPDPCRLFLYVALVV